MDERVELVHSSADAEVDGLVAEVNDETAKDRGVDLVGDLQALSLAGDGRVLEAGLQAGLKILGNWFGGGDGHGDLSPVGGHDGLEVLDDLVRFIETTVLGEDVEKVLGDLAWCSILLCSLQELGDSGLLFLDR